MSHAHRNRGNKGSVRQGTCTLPKPCTEICPAMQDKRPEEVRIIPLELQAMLEQSLSLQLERNVVPVTRV